MTSFFRERVDKHFILKSSSTSSKAIIGVNSSTHNQFVPDRIISETPSSLAVQKPSPDLSGEVLSESSDIRTAFLSQLLQNHHRMSGEMPLPSENSEAGFLPTESRATRK